MKNASHHPPSLRKRYITFTVGLGLLIMVFTGLILRGTLLSKAEVTEANETIQKEQLRLQQIRGNLLKIYRNIDLFLLDPLHPGLREDNDRLIAETSAHAHWIENVQHPYHLDYADRLARINAELANFEQKIQQLMEYRMDVNRQYPGMALSANEMPVYQNGIFSGLALLAEEIETADFVPESDRIYPLILKSVGVWSNTISQMRIYLANRFASFSTDILQQQAQSVLDFHNLLLNNLQQLEAYYAGSDSFEGPQIIARMQRQAESWMKVFNEVREYNESDWWRSDTQLMRTEIIPQVDLLNVLVSEVESFIYSEKVLINEALRDGSKKLSAIIVIIIILFIAFIAALLFSLEWLVFNPIQKVSLALRSKAFNIELPRIDEAKSEEMAHLIDAFREMDEEISLRQNALEHQAMHDHLTGLPNRFLLNQRIEYQLLASERQDSEFVLFLMDLDHFKDINDTLGHAIGDALLIQVAQRIQQTLRKSDTMARLGGDEFSILLPDTGRQGAALLAEKIIDATATPFFVDSHRINVGISVGMVSYPQDGNDPMLLLQRADMAMYSAKRERLGFTHYRPEENSYSTERIELTADLQTAIENNQLELQYQPKIAVDKNAICGAEALLRWQHPKHGFIAPDKVVEIAEHIGIIHKLTHWVLENAIRQCSHWHAMGHHLSVAVNLSVRDLGNANLVNELRLLLEDHNLPSHYLVLEITESMMMENLARSLELLNGIHAMGVKLSIDDFGTGFSSLAYLKRLPVNELKIDKSFIIEMDRDKDDPVIVQSTVNLGHNLGLRVVAEGVENARVMALLQELGCDEVQGYYFARPQNSDQFEILLRNAAAVSG